MRGRNERIVFEKRERNGDSLPPLRNGGSFEPDADLSPERRLQGGQGQGLATYRELIRNLSTKTRPEGGALALVLDRWVKNIQRKAAEECGSSSGTVYAQKFHGVLETFLDPLCELVHGYDFSAGAMHLLSRKRMQRLKPTL